MFNHDFVLGPHVVRASMPSRVDDQVEDTGFQIEFALPEAAYRLSVFHCIPYKQHPFDFGSLFVREDDLPFETPCWNHQFNSYVGGPYIALTAFLAELYRRLPGLIPVQTFFADLFEYLPVRGWWSNRPTGSKYPLKEKFTSAGFRVSDVQPYGRRIDIQLAWMFPQVRSSDETECYLYVCNVEFRPKSDRTLNCGRWIAPREHCLEATLFGDLRKILPGKPIELFKEAACTQMLEGFDWTPLALMTNQEARQSRIHFVRSHPHLISDPKGLAEALKGAGLYGPDTSLHQIRKFVGGLIEEARLEQP